MKPEDLALAARIGGKAEQSMSHEDFELGQRRFAHRDADFRSPILAMLSLAVLALGACSNSQPTSNAYQLVTAKYADCQQQGDAMAQYLDTGLPALYDSFGWTDQRQAALSLTGAPRKLYIQQQADVVILQCDTNEAQRQAAEPTAEQEAQASLESMEQTRCEGVGATWRWGVCYVGYLSPNDGETYYYSLSFDSDGNIVPGVGPQTAAECAVYGVNIQTQWHSDTDVCSL